MFLLCKTIKQDKPTVHGRIYNEAAMQRIVDMTKEHMRNSMCGVYINPLSPYSPSLTDIVGLVDEVSLVDGEIGVNFRVVAQEKFDYFSRFMGKFDPPFSISPIMTGHAEASTVVCDNLKLICWELVPGYLGACIYGSFETTHCK